MVAIRGVVVIRETAETDTVSLLWRTQVETRLTVMMGGPWDGFTGGEYIYTAWTAAKRLRALRQQRAVFNRVRYVRK